MILPEQGDLLRITIIFLTENLNFFLYFIKRKKRNNRRVKYKTIALKK